MKKTAFRILGGIGGICFAIALLGMKEVPAVKGIEDAGWMLLTSSLGGHADGYAANEMVLEMLGGKEYFYPGRESEQELVLAENQKKSGGVDSSKGNQIMGDVYSGESEEAMAKAGSVLQVQGVRKPNAAVEKLRSTLDTSYLWSKFYIIDNTTSVKKNLFDVKKLLETDLKLPKKKGKKQILIYHTHGASERFTDSSDKLEDSIVGVGTELAKELEKRGYGVYHDKTRYDWIDGRLERSLAYNAALEGIQKIRRENPDIRVMIDLHRDSVGKGKHTYTTINGRQSAIVMFFNGLSRNRSGPIDYLYNPNLQGNLAFSLQLKCKAMEYYDGFTKPIYLKGYRYNLHLESRSLLIELGNENNTVAEAKNAAAPLADVLDKVLSGQG
ncbi:MAG: stage II sporulation protein P [Eubacterium sp.]|jgi:stage II sporulation protein P|nr:stage II sporulation protein P [Eubacterium sp.]